MTHTHFISGCIVPSTFTLCFHFLAVQPVCRSHSANACFFDPHVLHLHKTLQEKLIKKGYKKFFLNGIIVNCVVSLIDLEKDLVDGLRMV